MLVNETKRIDKQDLSCKRDKTIDSENLFFMSELQLIEFTGLTSLQGQSTKQKLYSHGELSIYKSIKIYRS